MANRSMPAAQRWLNSWWPSQRLGKDPLDGVLVDARYRPVSIANWKLTPHMKRVLLRERVAKPLTFARGQRLTIVIPFRDRDAHLQQLLPVLRSTLSDQHIEASVLVVEQAGRDLFNRGKLINIGIEHAAARTDYYCLHDVDAVPVAANYLCPSQPLRLVNKLITAEGSTAEGESQRTDYYFSGAVSITREQVFRANGYSNEYRGWGKEDDDFFFRLLLAGTVCYFDVQGVFKDLPNPMHQQVQRKSPDTPPHVRINRQRRSRLLRGLDDPQADGLSTLRYELLGSEQGDGYEKICVGL
jgi:hypothetical protein